jgi:hypothetical protein
MVHERQLRSDQDRRPNAELNSKQHAGNGRGGFMDVNVEKFREYENDVKSKTHVEWRGVAVDVRSGIHVLYINGETEVLEIRDINKFRDDVELVLRQEGNVSREWRL